MIVPDAFLTLTQMSLRTIAFQYRLRTQSLMHDELWAGFGRKVSYQRDTGWFQFKLYLTYNTNQPCCVKDVRSQSCTEKCCSWAKVGEYSHSSTLIAKPNIVWRTPNQTTNMGQIRQTLVKKKSKNSTQTSEWAVLQAKCSMLIEYNHI